MQSPILIASCAVLLASSLHARTWTSADGSRTFEELGGS